MVLKSGMASVFYKGKVQHSDSVEGRGYEETQGEDGRL